jgi:hypothetical protein
MIYMGVGSDWYPDAPLVDRLIGARLKARGHLGTRDGRSCRYGSTIKSQALEYARGADEAWLRVLEPRPGCVVSWVPGMKDMLLELQEHISRARWNGPTSHGGVVFGGLVRDIGGDIGIAETYLELGRQKRKIGAIIDSFLDIHPVLEHRLTDTCDVMEYLDGHEGELWLTGPCLVRTYDPEIHLVPSPAPTVGMPSP